MISALADAGAGARAPGLPRRGGRRAEFIRRDLRDADGRLLRTYNRGRAQLTAYLEDHAFLLEALLTLYETTFDPRWFEAARELAETILARFADAERGGFFATADDHEALVARRKELEDTRSRPARRRRPTGCCGWPRSPASTATRRRRSARCSCCTRRPAATRPRSGTCRRRLDFHLAPVKEVAIVGPDAALERVVRGAFRPHVVLAGGPADGVPLLEGRDPVDGRAAA